MFIKVYRDEHGNKSLIKNNKVEKMIDKNIDFTFTEKKLPRVFYDYKTVITEHNLIDWDVFAISGHFKMVRCEKKSIYFHLNFTHRKTQAHTVTSQTLFDECVIDTHHVIEEFKQVFGFLLHVSYEEMSLEISVLADRTKGFIIGDDDKCRSHLTVHGVSINSGGIQVTDFKDADIFSNISQLRNSNIYYDFDSIKINGADLEIENDE